MKNYQTEEESSETDLDLKHGTSVQTNAKEKKKKSKGDMTKRIIVSIYMLAFVCLA